MDSKGNMEKHTKSNKYASMHAFAYGDKPRVQ